MSQKGRVLILDDKENWRKELEEMIQNNGYFAMAVNSVDTALENLRNDALPRLDPGHPVERRRYRKMKKELLCWKN